MTHTDDGFGLTPNTIAQTSAKVTRVSFRQWDKNDYDLSVTRLQMTHTDDGFGLTPNTIVQTSVKVSMPS